MYVLLKIKFKLFIYDVLLADETLMFQIGKLFSSRNLSHCQTEERFGQLIIGLGHVEHKHVIKILAITCFYHEEG